MGQNLSKTSSGKVNSLEKIYKAAIGGHTEEIKLLIEDIPASERLQLLMIQDKWGFRALHEAAIKGHTEVVKLLIEDITASDRLQLLRVQDTLLGRTALDFAACGGHTEVIKLLIEAIPASYRLQLLRIQDKEGYTALHWAATAEHANIFLILGQLTLEQRYKSLIEQRSDGKTVLHILATANKITFVTVLNLAGSFASKLLAIRDKKGRLPKNVSSSYKLKRFLTVNQDSFFLHKAPAILIFFTTNERDGAVKEVLSILRAFRLIGIQPVIHQNFTTEILLKEINSRCEKGDISALVIVTMSHGDKGALLDQNNEHLDVQQIIVALSDPKLDCIPKVLIMQACRSPVASSCIPDGTQTRTTRDGLDIQADSHTRTNYESCASMGSTDSVSGLTDAGKTTEVQETFHITQANFLVACSALHGRPAYRNNFIPCLARLIEEAPQDEDFFSTLTKVTHETAHDPRHQIPIFQSTLKAKLLLKQFYKQPE